MSKFLDFLERVREGAPTPLGFGTARAEKLPGMALVGLVSGDHAKGIGLASKAAADAVMVEGADGPAGLKKVTEPLTGTPWGARVSSLDEKQAQSLEAGGSDLVAFTVEGTAASALATGEIARILCIGTGIEERQLRALASLPVDAFLLSMKDVSGTWTLQDLATVGAISRRVDKYILVEVSGPPGNKDLEALRDIGVSGVVVDVGALGATKLKKLKTSLLEMPRHRSRRRERIRAALPGLVYGAAPEPQQEEEDDEGDDDE